MRKYFVVTLLCLLSFSNFVHGQEKSLSDYSFVVVPEVYDFQNRPHQFRLNGMTKFYLNKYGFHAFYSDELPQADLCEGLKVEVLETNKLLGRSLQLNLKDCHGTIVYEGPEEKSYEKNLERVHALLLRQALSHLETLKVKQKPLVPLAKNEVVLEKEDTTKEIQTATPTQDNLYSDGEKVYILISNGNDYDVYLHHAPEVEKNLIGKIISFGNNYKYIDKENKVVDVRFLKDGSIEIKQESELRVWTKVKKD